MRHFHMHIYRKYLWMCIPCYEYCPPMISGYHNCRKYKDVCNPELRYHDQQIQIPDVVVA
ncbi:unnamed protein product [Schistosoma curassoni]|uniref:Uncharacterized protein n=1 Tax=Schistosoma curassoni TaxID=6186 RepID=A0A183KTL5_9TREM|nr:unnamed protein product [Schistosoma curassoni]